MKYGVNTMVWTTRVGKDQRPLFSRIRDWGFDGAELFLSPQEPADLPAVKRILDELHLERTTCSVISREANLVSPHPAVRARGVEFLTRCVERTAGERRWNTQPTPVSRGSIGQPAPIMAG